MSESIKELAGALAKAQSQMQSAKKDVTNTFFKSKYADLASVVEVIKAPLSDNGLSYSQLTDVDDSGVYVETILMHQSGEWIGGRLRMPVAKANDPQALGSAMTYCRRFALQAIVGVSAEDDDANKAGNKPDKPPVEQQIINADIKPTAGVMDLLKAEEQKQVLDMGIEVKDAWAQGDLQTAFMRHRKHNKTLDSADAKAALWDQYDSKLRAALMKKLEETKATQEALKAQMAGSQA